jgi:cytochrome c553
MLRRLTAAALLATLTACVPAGEDGPGVDPNVGEDTGGSGGDDTGGAQDAGGEQDTGGGEVDAGGGAQDAGGGPVADVPTDGAAMFTWLQRGEYEAWPAESGVHASTGPHGQVRTFINPTLESSLQAESAEHPVGAASVKELYRDAEVFGWAVMVKTQAGTGGESWYWYEVFSTTDGSNPVADGNGVGLCAGCHSAGVDSVLTPYPLQ